MQVQRLLISRVDLAYIALGTVFVSFGFASCVVAAIRRRSQASVLLWLGVWSGMYGVSLLLRQPAVFAVLPHWLHISAPFTVNAISFLLVVVGLLVWSELTRGKMRSFTQLLAIVGLAIAVAGIGKFIATGSANTLLPANNLLAVCALIALAAVVTVPSLSSKYLAFPNRILTAATLVFTAEALFRNVWGGLSLPYIELPLLDETAFAFFLFSFAYVAGEKVFASEWRLLAIESELEVARQIQASILPAHTPETDALRIAASYLPMTAIGGDFYEFVEIDPHRVGFLVADVSGHGVPAALISTMLKVAMQTVVPHSDKPAEVLRGLNRVLSGQLRGQLISAAYLFVNTESSKAWLSSAGHPPLLRWRAGTLQPIQSNGLLFGVISDAEYPVREIALNPGDRFLLYTDGVVEPEDATGEAFGDKAMERVVRKHAHEAPADLSAHLLEELRRWQPAGVAQQDDVTLLVIDVL